MNDLTSLHPHSSSLNVVERAVMENRRAGTPHLRPQLISDGVVAGYIHDISIRHGNGVSDARQRRRRGEQR